MAANKFLSTYNPAKSYSEWDFYILNKGKNSGKPLIKPCPNCFVFHCDSYVKHSYFYWLVYAMWQAKAFHPLLIGSVILFIRIAETNRLINDCYTSSILNKSEYEKYTTALINLQKQKENLQQMMTTTEQMKVTLLRKALML